MVFPDDDRVAEEWLAAPDDVIGGAVPVDLMLARETDAAVLVSRMAAFPTGFELDIELRTRLARPGADALDPRFDPADALDPRFDAFAPIIDHEGDGSEPRMPEIVRIELEFADGRRASSLGTVRDDPDAPLDPARDIAMQPGGGSGGPNSQYLNFWVWPLPPEGRLRFACDWPAHGITDATAHIDASLIRAAAARARSLWSD